MELSLLNFLNLFPATGGVKEGEAVAAVEEDDAAGSDALSSFEEWLDGLGIQDGGVGAEIAVPEVDVGAELVPNLVLAQGSGQTLTPAQLFEQLTGVDEVDLASLSNLTLSKEQATRLADMMRKYLQRPDVNAGMGESQRSVLAQMATQLQQTTEEGQALAPVLKPLVQAQGVSTTEVKERAPLVGQMMKWLKQVLRESAKPATANAATAANATSKDAPAKEPARISFPGDILGEIPQVAKGAEPDETVGDASHDTEADPSLVVPVVTLPVVVETPEVVLPEIAASSVTPTPKNTPALAEQLIEEAAPQDVEANTSSATAPQASTKAAAPETLPSADFAQMLDVAQTHETMKVALDTAQPQLTLKAAAPLAKETPALPERVLGGSATGEIKVLGMSPVREQSLQLAESTQAVNAATETSGAEEGPSYSTPVADGSDVPVNAGATASGFHVGQSTTSYQPSAAYHYANARVAVPEQVQVAVKQASADGIDRITIQLQPEELGRIDVRLDMHSDGRAHIVFTVDKADTFEQLQRDARMLEKALQDAGVQTDAGSMEFNLRQHAQQEMPSFGNGGRQQGQEQSFVPDDGASAVGSAVGTETAIDDVDTITRTYTLTPEQGLDIRV